MGEENAGKARTDQDISGPRTNDAPRHDDTSQAGDSSPADASASDDGGDHERSPYFTDERAEESLAAERRLDPHSSLGTRAPRGARVMVRCIWLTEVYGPSHVPDFLSALKRLDWRTGAFGRESCRLRRTAAFSPEGPDT